MVYPVEDIVLFLIQVEVLVILAQDHAMATIPFLAPTFTAIPSPDTSVTSSACRGRPLAVATGMKYSDTWLETALTIPLARAMIAASLFSANVDSQLHGDWQPPTLLPTMITDLSLLWEPTTDQEDRPLVPSFMSTISAL